MSEVDTQNPATDSGVSRGTSTPPASQVADLGAQRIAEQAGALVMQARRAERHDRLGEAKKLLQQALAIAPTDISALELLGDIFLHEAEQEKAKKVFEHGLKFHPRHRAFEEKIALCIIDLEEMRRQHERGERLIELGDRDSWMNLSPKRALGLSILLPGAGHVYAEEIERAAWVFGAYLFTVLGWLLPLYFGIKSAAAQGVKGLDRGISSALGDMSVLGLCWSWLMVAASVAIYVFALVDATAATERANERRKHGLDEIGF
jgi:tetratricopeptide (TPR) repeat protein